MDTRYERRPRLILAILLGGFVTSASAQTWATATSTNAENGRVIIFRFIDELRTGFETNSQPSRVILAWRYEDEADRGMPLHEERLRMDAMEDLLQPSVEENGFATLALVSTGEHLREWVYYAKDGDELINRLNVSLSGQSPFPLEIHVAHDPTWKTRRDFMDGLKR